MCLETVYITTKYSRSLYLHPSFVNPNVKEYYLPNGTGFKLIYSKYHYSISGNNLIGVENFS